jgi:hypothetical protein
MKNFLKIVRIDEYSVTPKYLQVVNSILSGIEAGKIEKGDLEIDQLFRDSFRRLALVHKRPDIH